MAYAENTSVPVDRSKSEIERILAAYGAKGFAYGTDDKRAMIQFKANNRIVRFILPFPDPMDDSYRRTPTGRTRKSTSHEAAYEQEIRRRWRALSLAIKAKLEVVETGISEFEDEFMAHIVMPDGKTVSESVRPAIESAYSSGKPVALLPGF